MFLILCRSGLFKDLLTVLIVYVISSIRWIALLIVVCSLALASNMVNLYWELSIFLIKLTWDESSCCKKSANWALVSDKVLMPASMCSVCCWILFSVSSSLLEIVCPANTIPFFMSSLKLFRELCLTHKCWNTYYDCILEKWI